jgi:hypothetical protein
VLTPLQEQVASIVAGLAEAENFALAGGAALIVRGDILAVFGRAEARDFVDLAAVEARYGLDRLFELAAEKDHGFTTKMFAEMAGRFSRLRPDEFGLDTERYEQLEREVLEWQEQARNG